MLQSRKLASSALSYVEWDDGSTTDVDDNGEDQPQAARTGTLRVTFTNGSSYTYEDVSEEEFNALADSDSPGRTWHAMFKGR